MSKKCHFKKCQYICCCYLHLFLLWINFLSFLSENIYQTFFGTPCTKLQTFARGHNRLPQTHCTHFKQFCAKNARSTHNLYRKCTLTLPLQIDRNVAIGNNEGIQQVQKWYQSKIELFENLLGVEPLYLNMLL